MNRDRRFTVRGLLGAALLALGSAASAQGAPEKFTFSLNWFAVGERGLTGSGLSQVLSPWSLQEESRT